jgi:hypothetical protein
MAQSVAAGATNTQPSDDIEEWQTLILKNSGAVPTDLVFTNKSWRAFRLDTTIKDNAITFPNMNPYGNQINPGAQINKGRSISGGVTSTCGCITTGISTRPITSKSR